jgi:nucleoside 2-deoxyribosyltransferase
MDYVYIAGPLFDDHERSYLESIAKIFEDRGYKTFLPHRDAGVIKDKYTQEVKDQIFTIDIEALDKATIVVALLTGRDVDSGTSAEIGYAFAKGKTLIGIDANNVKFLNIFVWGLLGKGENIYNSLKDLERYLDEQ